MAWRDSGVFFVAGFIKPMINTNYIIKQTIAETFQNFRNVSESFGNIILRENGHCIGMHTTVAQISTYVKKLAGSGPTWLSEALRVQWRHFIKISSAKTRVRHVLLHFSRVHDKVAGAARHL